MNPQSAQTYHRIKNRLFFVGLAVNIGALVAVMASGFSLQIKDFALIFSSNSFLLVAIYMTALGVLFYLIQLPFDFYEGYLLEHRFNLSNQNVSQWLKDHIKRGLLGSAIGLLLVEVIYVCLRNFPQSWWIGAGAFYLLLTLVLARITPSVIIPLFYKYSQITNQELRGRILELFHKVKLDIKDAYAINFSAKTKKANAFICGLGKSRRVVLSDTLIENFSVPEIETVVAHEIGHYKHRDILKLTIVNAVITFVGFFLIDQLLQAALRWSDLAAIDDIAFFPVVILAFMLFGVLVMPLVNAYSRRIERAADRFCLDMTQRPREFISMMEKLGRMNLAEDQPGRFVEFFFYDHPPIGKRIQFAREFQPQTA